MDPRLIVLRALEETNLAKWTFDEDKRRKVFVPIFFLANREKFDENVVGVGVGLMIKVRVKIT